MTKLTKKQESLLNELVADFNGDAEDLLGKNGLMMQFDNRVLGQWQCSHRPVPCHRSL